MYLESNKKSKCSGCTACMNICPKNAIQMIEDEEGFLYPEINKDKCINCGACIKICPNIKKDKTNSIISTLGVKHKNEKERITSRSGGVFVALSDYILNLNGTIYGARLNEDFTVSHERAETIEERNEFKGSKYVQSDMNNIAKSVKEDLKNNRKVLFSGTACQVAGIKAFIPENLQENLYTCDLICHGVPSKKIFFEFLKYIENISEKNIKEFIFRDKSFGWESHYETAIFEDETTLTTQYFRNLFYGHNILRPACYECNYANTHRPADVTIADFWGIDEIAPEFLDSKGVSLIIINNDKGKEWVDNIKEDLDFIECDIEECIKHTYTLNQPTPRPETREQFWEDYQQEEFEQIIEKYAN